MVAFCSFISFRINLILISYILTEANTEKDNRFAMYYIILSSALCFICFTRPFKSLSFQLLRHTCLHVCVCIYRCIDMDVLVSYLQDTSLGEVNSFSPSMPISPSSMINQYKFEDEPELRDLFITVDDPESHITAIETFITYRVVTKVSIYSWV